jgi:hypothetical protein
MLRKSRVILIAFVVGALAPRVRADFTAFAGDALEEASWQLAAGGNVPLENFEGYTGVTDTSVGGDVLTALPSLHVTFDTPAPGIYDAAEWAHSGTKQWSNWAGGAGNSASHVLRPTTDRRIYALGFWNCDPQGIQTMEAYDDQDNFIGVIAGDLNSHNSHPEDSSGFAGFVSTTPIAYVRIPGDFGDGWNHLDDLQIVTRLVADYNGDGVVDTADYTVWRSMLGQSGDGLAADGDFNGTVDGADYQLWRSSFGATAGGAGAMALSRSAVPEPSSLALLTVAICALVAMFRHREITERSCLRENNAPGRLRLRHSFSTQTPRKTRSDASDGVRRRAY